MRLVRETGKPIARVARDLGINDGTLGNWVNADRRRRDGGDGRLSEVERGRARAAPAGERGAADVMRCAQAQRGLGVFTSCKKTSSPPAALPSPSTR